MIIKVRVYEDGKVHEIELTEGDLLDAAAEKFKAMRSKAEEDIDGVEIDCILV